MKALKINFLYLSAMVFLIGGFLLPVTAFSSEPIGMAIAVNGPVKLYHAGNESLNDLKMNDDVFSGNIIAVGANGGVQIAVSHHTSVSVGPHTLAVVNRRIDKKKRESHHVTLLRGSVRVTSYSKILPANPSKRLHIETPYGILSFDGADLVVDVNDLMANARDESAIPIPCPSGVTQDKLGELTGALEDGGLPKKRSAGMEACPDKQEKANVDFVGFQQPKIKKNMISKSGIEFISLKIIAGNVGYTPPSKKRPVLTLKDGEKMAFDDEGKAVLRD